MKVLIIGSGAREHVIAWKLRQSPKVTDIVVAPGNAGTARLARNLPIPANDIGGIVKAARKENADLVVIGPEEPLALGLADRLEAEGIAVFGPSQEAARIEASKAYAHELMERQGIPHPAGLVCSDVEAARLYITAAGEPPVVKADGLAAGKGVVVPASHQEAIEAIEAMMVAGGFGQAGRRVLLQQRLAGREVSVLAFSDGRSVAPMAPACDYKRVFDGDRGPNTGGMGAYSPPLWYDASLDAQVTSTVLERTIQAMAREGHPYRGVLYAGLMETREGLNVLEFNCRFGDPEAQVVLPRLKSDMMDVLMACVQGRLAAMPVDWSEEACVGVVLASGGYPGEYRTGFPIYGLDEVDSDVMIFYAGAKLAEDGKTVLTAGGRVLTVAATAPSLADARRKVYDNAARIRFKGMHYRKDIADL